jgi:hypothetical protein
MSQEHKLNQKQMAIVVVRTYFMYSHDHLNMLVDVLLQGILAYGVYK